MTDGQTYQILVDGTATQFTASTTATQGTMGGDPGSMGQSPDAMGSAPSEGQGMQRSAPGTGSANAQ